MMTNEEKLIDKAASPQVISSPKKSSDNAERLTKDGLSLYKQGHYEKALGAFNHSLERRPNDAATLTYRADTFDELKRYEEALADYIHSLQLRPHDPHTLNNHGFILNKLKQHEKALVEFNHSLKHRPNHASTLTNRGDTFRNLGRFEEALTDYKKSLELHGHNAYTLNQYGFVLNKLGRYQEALSALNHSLEHHNSVLTLANRYETFINLERYGEALTDCNNALALESNHKDILAHRGFVLDKLGRYQEALVDYNHSLELQPNHALTLSNRGNTFKNLGHYGEALSDYSHALELEPNDVSTLNNRGDIFTKLGRYQKAIADYKRSLKLHHHDTQTLSKYGFALYQLGRYEEALIEFNHFLKHCPNDAFILFNRGNTLKSLERYQEALADYNDCLKVEPNNAEIPAHRGFVLDKLGHFEEALVDYTRSLELRPKDAIILNSRANTLKKLGRYQEALVDCSHALKIIPTYNIALANRDEILHKMIRSKETKPKKPNFLLLMLVFLYAQIMDLLNHVIQYLTKKTDNSNATKKHERKIERHSKVSLEVTATEKIVVTHTKIKQRKKKFENIEEENENKTIQIASAHSIKKETVIIQKQIVSDSIKLEEVPFVQPVITQRNDESTFSEMVEENSVKQFDEHPDNEILQDKMGHTKEFEKKISRQKSKMAIMQQQVEILKKQVEENNIFKEELELQKNKYSRDSQVTKRLEETLKEQEVSLIKQEEHTNTLNQQIKQLQQQIEILQKDKLLDQTQQLNTNKPLVVNTFAEFYIKLPENFENILRAFEKVGYHALIVGGAVRALLMRGSFFDVDIITDMPSNILLTHFKEHSIKAVPYVSELYQMTQFNMKIDILYRSTDVFISRDAFFYEAQARAFTVNALYCDAKGKIYDPLQMGYTDLLHYPLLRLIGDTPAWFERDPILLLRASRLAAQYKLSISPLLKLWIAKYSSLLKKLEPIRLHIEFKHLFLRGNAVKNLEYLIELGLFSILYPKLTLFLKSVEGEFYRKWMWNELYQTDQLIINQKPASICYVYAILLSGSVLAKLRQSTEKSSSHVNQVIDATVNESLQGLNIDFNKIQKTIIFFMQKFLLVDNTNQPQLTVESLRETPILIQFQSTSCSEKQPSLRRSRSYSELSELKKELIKIKDDSLVEGKIKWQKHSISFN